MAPLTSIGGAAVRRGSLVGLRGSLPLAISTSCPDLSKVGLTPHVAPSLCKNLQQRRRTLTVLNPRAPKIRYLNASHTLLMEMEKHVKKVQELEEKVFDLEMQLQMKEAVKPIEEFNKTIMPENITKMDADEEMAFNQRLVEARKRCELFTAKRIKEEEAVTRMYHEKRLKTVIEDMTNNSQNGTKVMLLPSPESKEDVKETESVNNYIRETEALLDSDQVKHAYDDGEINLRQEIDKLKGLYEESKRFKAMLDDAKAQKQAAETTYNECLIALSNISAAWSKFRASLKMTDQLTDIMKRSNHRQNSHKMYVFGQNSVFSSIKEQEISYAITNHFAIEMLKELDMSSLMVEKNLKSARECLKKSVENCSQAEAALLCLTEMLDEHTERVKGLGMDEALEAVTEEGSDAVSEAGTDSDATEINLNNQ